MKKSVFFQTLESRKGDIIASALRIIDRSGIKSLTVARLAQEVGFVESALYRHFKSKRDLVSFILDNILQEARNHLAEVEEKSSDSLEALQQLLFLHLKFLEEYPGIFKIIYSDEIHLGDVELQDKVTRLISEILTFVKKVIQKAMAERKLKADLDVTTAAMHFLGLVYTAFSYWTIKKRKVSLRKISAELLEQYLKGVTV
ncbi:MAG: TetR/AcrR family transcriptional regulator [Candidatus Saccharicenans sp.]|uniref:TetR/AcrR family transcriptional regulator n=1 Tax=Candidatus Saccharicenans sp. TaxID=2819258 RepID=UPI00404ABFC2